MSDGEMRREIRYGCAILLVTAFFCGGVVAMFLFAARVGLQ